MSRSTTVEEESNPSTTADDSYLDVFRRYFEAQFQPLELAGGPVSRDIENEEESEDSSDEPQGSESGSEWDGISESEDGDNQVEVVEHKGSSVKADDMTDKKARKDFMV